MEMTTIILFYKKSCFPSFIDQYFLINDQWLRRKMFWTWFNLNYNKFFFLIDGLKLFV